MEKKEVFISYRSSERSHAYMVKDILEVNGFSVWIAPDCIPIGSDYATEIPSAIQNCKAVVLILSTKAQRSKWVSKEIYQAINMGKIIMPFMVENCKLNSEFNFYLSNVQRYEAFQNKSVVLHRMITELCKITDKPLPETIIDRFPPESDETEPSDDGFTDENTESFFLKLTPYGRKRAKDPAVRTLLHAATLVAIPLAIVAFMSAPHTLLTVFLTLLGLMMAWYLSYGICLCLSRLKSKFAAVLLTMLLSIPMNILVLLIVVLVIPAIIL